MTSWRPYWWTEAILRELNFILGPVSRKSRNFSGHTTPFISSQRRGSKPSNLAILLVFLALNNVLKDQFFKASGLHFDKWLFGSEKFSGVSRVRPPGDSFCAWNQYGRQSHEKKPSISVVLKENTNY